MKVVVTGAAGFIGSAVANHFAADGHSVTALVRNAGRPTPLLARASNIRTVEWEASRGGEWRDAVCDADIVVHLAGASIGGRRWTDDYKRLLRDSRIGTTAAIVNAIAASGRAGGISLLSGSAMGYYGDGRDRLLSEESTPGDDFLSRVCIDWESEARKALSYGARVVLLRFGIVLGTGGALEKMLPPFRLGVGGPLGSGRQWMSWIHRADAVNMIGWAARGAELSGPLNVIAPNPVSMREFAATLGRVLRRPAVLPAPAFALRLLLGEFAESILKGQRGIPQVALNRGLTWRFPTLESALREILKRT